MNKEKKLLILEDEEIIRAICQRVLEKIGCEMFFASDLQEAREKIKILDTLDVLLTDIRLPDGDGMDAVSLVREKYPRAKIIIMTGSPDADARMKRLSHAGLNEQDVLTKPFDIQNLESKIKHCLEND